MDNIKELYCLGKPLETELGEIHFIKVGDYDKLMRFVPYINMDKNELLMSIAKYDKEIAIAIKDVPYISIIKELKDVFEVYNMFQELFILVFDRDCFEEIGTDEQFEEYLKLICEMNCLQREEKNSNPEIQYFMNLKKQLEKQKSNNGVSFESIYTSVWIECGNSPDDMTIYQMYALFNRIGQIKNYETTILYSTVSGEVKVEPWYRHVDLMNNKEQKTTLEEFSRNASQYTS